ncbi:hypothetical protein MSPP1_000367 [Malassezia sp. CBS 17886]|nr:hypothetical protein MSPP1_000367 [Malassezia sp. CBS 17886]
MGDRTFQAQLQSRYGDAAARPRAARPANAGDAAHRREARRAHALALRKSPEDDYVPLDANVSRRVALATDEGPHPESGLQREEDDLGSGEDEYAELTGATERIPIGHAAEQRQRRARRKQMRSMIDGVWGGAPDADDADEEIDIVVRDSGRPSGAARPRVGPSSHLVLRDDVALAGDQSLRTPASDAQPADDEDSGDEWERAQLSRMGIPAVAERPPTPPKAATIPLTSALPTPTSCLGRLTARMHTLEESAAAHDAQAKDARDALTRLAAEEADAKAGVEALEQKKAWFDELNTFVDTLAAFLDEKTPRLETIEHNALALLVDRAVSRQRARALLLEDDLVLFHGVADATLWVARGRGDDGGSRTDENAALRPVGADGGWQDARRVARRADATAERPSDTASSLLSETEIAHFGEGRADVERLAAQLLADTQSPVFLDPAVRSPDTGELDNASLAARFDAWRTKFPAEYDLSWGGLALANVWAFWLRRTVALWDPLWATGAAARVRSAHDTRLEGPAAGLEDLQVLADLSEYASSPAARGGDAEALESLVAAAVVPRLTQLGDQGAYDPWSAVETGAALHLVDQVSCFLDAGSWRFQALVRSFLVPFERHVAVLADALAAPIVVAAPPMHPDAPVARVRFLERVRPLAYNLVRWARFWRTHDERALYNACLDRLLGALWNDLVRTREGVGAAIAQEALEAYDLMPDEMRSRLQAIGGM